MMPTVKMLTTRDWLRGRDITWDSDRVRSDGRRIAFSLINVYEAGESLRKEYNAAAAKGIAESSPRAQKLLAGTTLLLESIQGVAPDYRFAGLARRDAGGIDTAKVVGLSGGTEFIRPRAEKASQDAKAALQEPESRPGLWKRALLALTGREARKEALPKEVSGLVSRVEEAARSIQALLDSIRSDAGRREAVRMEPALQL